MQIVVSYYFKFIDVDTLLKVVSVENIDLDRVFKAVNHYQSMRDTHTANAWMSAVFIPFFGLFIGGNELYIADGWSQGCDWWARGSETGWNDLIGSSTSNYRSITYSSFDYNRFYQCMYNGGGYGGYGYTYNRYNECSQQATTYATYYYYSPVNGLSDGLIPASSQIGFTSNWGGTSVEARNINHFQFQTDDDYGFPLGSMSKAYKSIFDGTAGADKFFFTESLK